MAIAGLKCRCIKCGYAIPLTSVEHKNADSVKCPKCTAVCDILRGDDETILEE